MTETELQEFLNLTGLKEKPKGPKGIPEGFTTERGPNWNLGSIFYWSEKMEMWINKNQNITVNPAETIREALVREGISPGYTVFFQE